MNQELKEEQRNRQLAYADAVKGKSEDEILALNYFFNTQKKKGCVKKYKIPLVTDAQLLSLIRTVAAISVISLQYF